MHDDAALPAGELAATEGPIVLLGHSDGGIPMTGAATGARNVERLIYLAASACDRARGHRRQHRWPGCASIYRRPCGSQAPGWHLGGMEVPCRGM
ncbi:hypothetical protein ACIBP6_19660 [Nonomuraea terrae]|uniref:hypothetical protein n=1 Tax=Nonomuraea terrae TaxID=2530383 RepID=UPI0037B459DC